MLVFISLVEFWRKGIRLLLAKLQRETLELNSLLESLERRPPARAAGAAVFMQTDTKFAPSALMHNLKHNRVLHDRLVFIAVKTAGVPHWEEDRVAVRRARLIFSAFRPTEWWSLACK